MILHVKDDCLANSTELKVMGEKHSLFLLIAKMGENSQIMVFVIIHSKGHINLILTH